jgi:hypothetical protein
VDRAFNAQRAVIERDGGHLASELRDTVGGDCAGGVIRDLFDLRVAFVVSAVVVLVGLPLVLFLPSSRSE